MLTNKVIILLLLAYLACSSQAPPFIYSVSNVASSVVYPVTSSLRGGKFIYIKAVGHNPDPSQNLIYVGTIPCIIPSDGVTDTFISCVTGDSGSNSDISNLPVTLIAYGTSYTTSYPNLVSYYSYITPQLTAVYPTAGYGGENVNLYGLHRISNIGDGLRVLGDITKLSLGGDLCSRFDVFQKAITSNWYDYILCVKSNQQQAGKYNVSEQLVLGYSNHYPFMRRSSFNINQNFEFTALPTITSISPNNGNLGGQYLTILGNGFSPNVANNSVTVDGNNCVVTYSSITEIDCTLAARNTNLSSALSTNSTSQQNGYFSGAGLNYARYTLSNAINSNTSFVNAVRTANTTSLGTPQQVGYRADLREGDVYGTNYAQTWNGYFTAPVSGTYTFRGTGDDFFCLYLAQTYGSTELPSTPLIYTSQYQVQGNFYVNDYPTAQANVTLTAGKSYYLEAYHINGGYAGHFSLEVDVPNTDNTLSFQVHQVDYVNLSSIVQPQVVTYTMTGGSSGTIQLGLTRYSGYTVIYGVSVNITYGCTASTFQSALNQFDIYSAYAISVVRNIYDASRNILANTTSAASIDYVVSIYKLRASTVTSQSLTITNIDYTGKLTVASSIAHSPIISGTFTLSIAGQSILVNNSTNIPYNVSPDTLQAAIRSSPLVGFGLIEVAQYANVSCDYGCNWIIQYKGFNAAVPSISANGALLSGGTTTPIITAYTRRYYSANLAFDPVDYRFLNTQAPSLNVLVNTNGIPAICNKTCAYTFASLSQITSLSLSGSILSLAVSDPTAKNFAATDISITVGGLPCIVATGSTPSSLSCYLQNNTDNTPILVAGSLTPLVSIKNIGIAGLKSGVNPLTVNLVATSLSIASGGANGGILITLVGQGFPLDKTKITITVCSKQATIKSVTNINAQFYLPSCGNIGNSTVIVAVGSQNDSSLLFNYLTAAIAAPIISSLNPPSANPGVKGTLQINGQNFGTDATQVTVFLSNSTGKIYQLTILTLNSTYIKVGLPGGSAGNYIVQVNTVANGDSVAGSANSNAFSYVVSVASVSPATGSYNGGTLLTITGSNFSPVSPNTLVYIGDTLNWFCNIENITATTILCRTPAISSTYSAGTAVTVYVSTRLIILNTCTGTCSFTYLAAASSPTLTAISTTSTNSGNITLTGTNLLDLNSFAQVSLTNTITNQVIVLPSVNSSNTSVTFTLTSSVISGTYNVKVRNLVGQSNSLQLAVTWSIGQVSWQSGGSVAGGIVTVSSGSGYPSSIDGVVFSVIVSSGTTIYPTNIVSCCGSNTISLELPPASNGTVFTLSFVGPVNTANTTYTTSISLTLTANITGVTSDANVTVGTKNITFAATNNVSATITAIKLVSTLNSSHVVNVANGTWTTTGSGSTAVTTFSATLYAGSYKLLASTSNGYISMNNTINIAYPTNVITNAQQVSFNGGSVTISASYLSPVSYITVNGFIGPVISASSSSVTYAVPPLVTTGTQSAFSLASVSLLPTSQFSFFSDQNSSTAVGAAFDGSIKTAYSSPNTQCWIGLDAGSGLAAAVSRISFFGNLSWANVAQYILYSTFQGSNDQATWKTLVVVDQTVHSGWNVYATNDTTPYRYVRFLHNSTSQCGLAEVQLYGILYSTVSATLSSQFANVVYNDGFNSQVINNLVEYRQNATPTVNTISPRYGDIAGGYNITLTGTYLNAGNAVITIDGILCSSPVSTATTIICTVGARTTTPKIANNFTVIIGGSNAILNDKFLYVLKWSSATTWGVDSAPIDNDLVYVPLGTTLLVDVNTSILQGIAVQGGTLVFSDTADLIVQAGFITMNGGTFIAGTAQHPYTHQLTFILYGNYYGTQQPMFGNKGIGCLNCKFYMYGTPRIQTWTTITATINVGDTTFTVKDNIDWVQGQQIVVASTSFIHTEAEQKNIVSVSGKTVTVDTPFQYKHVSVIEPYGTKYLVMQAQVGLLTRNIKVMGSSDSVTNKYGSHLMLSGKSSSGFEAQVAYSEFTHCGQPQILGRYCIHFHMAGDIPTSFAKGNAVHESFARVITIHGVHYLTVEDNVGYRVSGHNFFVQDGIQTHNIIRNNLAISSLAVTNMLQTDTSVASFWITNPTNDFYGNHAAGGDFYGIWYEIKPNPDGPSATMDVCPTGNPLGYVTNNTAHSNIRFGLRVFQLQSRLYPCNPVRNNSNPIDSWADNPSIQAVFSNFTVYKNLEDGVLSEQAGNVVYDNFVIAENYHSGVQFYLANFTKEPPTIQNSVIIGMSASNSLTDLTNYTKNMSGAITGRSGVNKLSNIGFYNYPSGSLLFQTCRLCDDPDHYTNVGTQVIVQKLTFSQVNGKMLYMINMKRDVIYDLDGSFVSKFDNKSRASATIVWGFPHIANSNQGDCPSATYPAAWDNAVMCGANITIRRVLFSNIINHQLFVSQLQKAKQLTTVNDTVAANTSALLYSASPSQGFFAMQPEVQTPYTWSMPYITGRIYAIWWGTGIDFTHLSIYTTPNFPSTDNGIIFKFNYSQNRELYQIGPMSGGVKRLTSLDYFNELNDSTLLNASTCGNGQYFHDNQQGDQRKLAVCISGKNRTQYEYVQVNGIVCLLNCPAPAGTFVKENFIRKWSNLSQWANGVLPPTGSDLVVNGNWTVILDIDPNVLNNLTIDGTLIADDTRDVNITANFIHIRAGNVTAGSSSTPFLHKFTIQINGQKTSNTFFIDSILTANKLFAVTGSLNLFGNAPGTVSTYLTQTAFQNSSTLYVGSSNGWSAGDTLVLSPSFATYSEFQKVTIQAINSDGSINLTAPLTYTHYGSGSLTINNNYGQLDTRTRVGHINRNIMIVPGPDAGWGYTLTVYGFMDQANVTRIGSVQLNGVQFQDGGQLESLNSPLVFLNLLGNTTSLVTATSFVNCKANCIYVKNSQNVTINNNVLYNAYVFGAQFSQIKSVSFTNNVIIGVYEKPTLPQGSELVACVYASQYVNPLTDAVAIQNNYCLGSSQDGYAFPHIKCSQFETNPFANNTVGSAQIGFILNNIGQDCQAFSYAKAFACKIGQICGAFGVSTLMFNQFLMADNGRSITLKIGDSEGRTNHTAFLYNSYISAVSRPTCTECYGSSATVCSGNHGMRMFVPSANGEQTPKKFNSGFDVICKQPVYDSKSFLVNVTFDNYRQNYTGVIASACNSNFAFKPHSSAWDQSGSVYLFTSKCTNCDTGSYLLAPAPNPAFIGWFGGCGDIVCTGLQNYLIQDFDGTFLGSKSTIIPNNSVIATNENNCTFVPSMNAYLCNRSDFGVLEYQNIGSDFNTRIMWPVSLFYDGSNYTTVSNGWREWDWLGLQPQNHRFGRFVSIIKLNQTYNMSFTAQPPSNLQLQLQKRQPLGESQNYVIVRIYYPLPNSIRVLYKGAIVDPILLTDFNNTSSGILKNLDTTTCGSNIYFYTNRTIAFVVTSAIDCLISVEITESVQLTTHFAADISTFFSSNSTITNFINNLCALLNIVDTSRVKIVGVFSGSVAVTTQITPSTTAANDMSNISSTITQAITNGTLSANLSNIGLGNVLSANTVYNGPTPGTIYTSNTTSGGSGSGSGSGAGSGSSSSSSFSPAIIAGVSVASVVLVVGIVITVIYLLRRRSKVVQEIVSHEDEVVQQKSVEKDKANYMFNETSEIHNESEIKIKAAKLNPNALKVREIENSEVIDY